MSLMVSHAFHEEELAEIFKLRYKVYCLEWGFENPGNHSDRIIKDKYDNNSIHFVARDDSQRIAGAVMLILNSSEGYPIEKYCELDIDTSELPKKTLAEISRLVIHRDFRRRKEDKYIYGPDEERRSIGSFNFPQQYQYHKIYHRRAEDKYRSRYSSRRSSESQVDRRRRHEVLIELYKAVYRESKQRQITHWYAVMTKGIVTLLNKFGFSFDAIGDPVDYHGVRTPYLAEIEKLEQEMSSRNPELYEEFTKDI